MTLLASSAERGDLAGPCVLPLEPAPDPASVLLGLAAARADGEDVEPLLVGVDDALHGEAPARRLVLGLRPEARFTPAPPAATPHRGEAATRGGADFPWQEGSARTLASIVRFLDGGPAAGWIGHELGATCLQRHTVWLELEPATGRGAVMALPPRGLPVRSGRSAARDRARAAAEAFQRAAARGRSPALARSAAAGAAVLPVSAAEHQERVRHVLAAIAAGEVYQVNLSHPIHLPLQAADPVGLVATFLALWRANDVPYPALVEEDGTALLALSPERYLACRGEILESRPIKGTRPRHADPRRDAALARELAASSKDRAENVMIVDLVRNDLGRVAATGSVEVAALCQVETFASVHHLVSTVRARLRPGAGMAEILAAVHPAGSMTGAPKIRAVEILRRLEGAPRGAYAGGVGWFQGPRRFHLAMVIRTLIAGPRGAFLPVGGGVVADSDPADEHAETLHKARSLLAAMGGRLPPGLAT